MKRRNWVDYELMILHHLYENRNDPDGRIQARIHHLLGSRTRGYYAFGFLVGKGLITENKIGPCYVYTITDEGERVLRRCQAEGKEIG